MRFGYVVIALAASLALAGRLHAEDAAARKALAGLDRFVGEWTVDGRWADGSSLHARSVYEWGLNKRILKARTYVKDGEKEYQRYESVLAWHPDKKLLFEISFAFDGALSEYVVETAGKDTLRIGWTPFAADKPSRARQVIKFLDKDHFRWTVSLKEGDGWKQLIEAVWVKGQTRPARAPASSAPPRP
jgi:hypothetical protein